MEMIEDLIMIVIFIVCLILLIIVSIKENKVKKLEDEEREKKYKSAIKKVEDFEREKDPERMNGYYCYIENADLNNLVEDTENFENIVNEKSKSWKTKLTKYKPNKNIKLLLGDYDVESISYTVYVLKSMGIEITVVKSGLEIYKRILDGEKYDLIITNNIYKTGKLDGYPLLKELKQLSNFNIPVIVLTTSSAGRDLFVDEYGFSDYIQKKITQDDVKNIFSKHISNLKFTKVK